MPRYGCSPTLAMSAGLTAADEITRCEPMKRIAHNPIARTGSIFAPPVSGRPNAISRRRPSPRYQVGFHMGKPVHPSFPGGPRFTYSPLVGLYVANGITLDIEPAAAVRRGDAPSRTRNYALLDAHYPRSRRRTRPLPGDVAARLPGLSATRFRHGPASMAVPDCDQSMPQPRARSDAPGPRYLER